jgi:cytochrome c biogenesis protein CcmG/thiol:disulfide interchange protein DsbE
MLLFIVLLATRDRGDTGFASFNLEGKVAPAIVGTTIDGDTFDLDDYRGGFVVVNFFQTTCVPCRQEHPELVAFHETYAPSGFATVVSVAFDDRPSNIREFFEEFGGDWPVLATDTGSIAVSYGVPLVPESVLVAPDGEVITKLVGGIRMADLESVIQSWQEANA